eukprot:TRINITY_DN2394_c0_g1_i2.p1 TRINITY_DN2394_c0_g1~~TRINITY_DN2394_c0_g1_i2.p1  ORF type:complete len:229 (-),score=55.81 TRINITY_DN2394_c0_g1_i2:327-1013(-)
MDEKDDDEDVPTVMIKCRYQHDATELQIHENYPFQELERILKEEFAVFGETVIKYKDFDGDLVRLSARNINKVVSSFLKTVDKRIDMYMENEDDLEEVALQDENRVANFDNQMTQAVFDRKQMHIWGDGSRAQLCKGNLQSVTLAEEAVLLTQHFPKTMSTGAYHAVCITDDQNVLVWGCGEEGQLGLGNLEKFRYQADMVMSQPTPLIIVASSYLSICIISVSQAGF